jgi:hypothetical protein
MVAEEFYQRALGSTIMQGLFGALNAIKHRSERNLYVFWGLHFTTIGSASSDAASRGAVMKELCHSLRA